MTSLDFILLLGPDSRLLLLRSFNYSLSHSKTLTYIHTNTHPSSLTLSHSLSLSLSHTHHSMEPIMDNGVQALSGGELQRCAIVLCLGTPADIYLVDEPSAYLDSEQRIAASKVLTSIFV